MADAHALIQADDGFRLGDEADPLAKISTTRRDDGTIVITHTFVSETLKGQGIGGTLVQAVAEQARKENVKIIPLCSYANKVMTKDDSFADVLARAPDASTPPLK